MVAVNVLLTASTVSCRLFKIVQSRTNRKTAMTINVSNTIPPTIINRRYNNDILGSAQYVNFNCALSEVVNAMMYRFDT